MSIWKVIIRGFGQDAPTPMCSIKSVWIITEHYTCSAGWKYNDS